MPVTALLPLQTPATWHVTTGSTYLELSKGFKMVAAGNNPASALLDLTAHPQRLVRLSDPACPDQLLWILQCSEYRRGGCQTARAGPQDSPNKAELGCTCGLLLPGSAVGKTPPAGSVSVTVGSLKVFLRVLSLLLPLF